MSRLDSIEPTPKACLETPNSSDRTQIHELSNAHWFDDGSRRGQLESEPAGGVSSSVKGIFLKEGDYWSVGYGEKVFRLKDSTGLGYLAYLLRYPGTELHALDLGAHGARPEASDDKAGSSAAGLPMSAEELEAAGIHVGNLGDAGEILDTQAKAAYKARLRELREELEEAKEFGNVERAAKAEEEIDALSAELSRGVGLGGRRRRGGLGHGTSAPASKERHQDRDRQDCKERPCLGKNAIAADQDGHLLLLSC